MNFELNALAKESSSNKVYLFIIYLFNLIYIYGSPSGCIESDFQGAVQNTKNIYITNNIVKLNNNSNKQSTLTIYIYIYITKLLYNH